MADESNNIIPTHPPPYPPGGLWSPMAFNGRPPFPPPGPPVQGQLPVFPMRQPPPRIPPPSFNYRGQWQGSPFPATNYNPPPYRPTVPSSTPFVPNCNASYKDYQVPDGQQKISSHRPIAHGCKMRETPPVPVYASQQNYNDQTLPEKDSCSERDNLKDKFYESRSKSPHHKQNSFDKELQRRSEFHQNTSKKSHFPSERVSRRSTHEEQRSSIREVDYPSSRREVDYSSSRREVDYPSSRREVDYPSSRREVDYPSSRREVDYPSSRREVDYPSSRREVDYPSSRSHHHSPKYRKESRKRSCSHTRHNSYSRQSRSPERHKKQRSYDHSKNLQCKRPKKENSCDNVLKKSKKCQEVEVEDQWKKDLVKSSSRVDLSNENLDEEALLQLEANTWIRSSPAEVYYLKKGENTKLVEASEKLQDVHKKFQYELVQRSERIKLTKPKYEPPQRKTKLRKPKPPRTEHDSSSSSSEESSSEEEDTALEELEKKKQHPDRMHEELWFNDLGEMNDGPLCRCSAKAKRSGIRHGIYTGEMNLPLCNPNSNNLDKLFHYRITMSPHTNFVSKCPTTIKHDGHEFIFEGFSMFSHSPLRELPRCKVIRFNIEYTILYIEEKFPENFTIQGLELFSSFLFTEILELVDLNWKAHDDLNGCPRFHFMPRFARALEDNGKELLSMNVVLQYLLNSNSLLVEEKQLPYILSLSQHKWQDLADEVKGMIVTSPGMKPSSIRVDQLDREICDPDKNLYPEIVHFGVRPPQLSYAGNPNYQKAWRDYVKFRHLLANKPKVVYADRHRLLQKEMRLQEMRMKHTLKRDVTVVISSSKFYRTGIMCDIVQHAMLIPVLVCHLRFHQSLDVLENKIGYRFGDRYLLQLALTHPSYRENFGTNPDHARNSLTNCGIRQPEYGDRRVHYMNTRKRGINTLINIMSRFGRREETTSSINHNERLEFLGDAVVEFLSSIHLFFMFPNLEEGGLATYRAAIVQNQHLAVLSKKLQLEKFMLYAHGSDLCHDLELRHAMANCFEALMGALFLDDGIEVADRVFSETLFTEPELLDVWVNYPPHPLQEQEPNGDRRWLSSVPLLQKLHQFEDATGMEFNHIRLLARAFTHRSLGYNNLTLGSNQRLEFLGDTVLQLVASEYLYKFFPEHHEGHLSLLRSSLVNNRTQSVVCDDLGMVEYAIYPYSKVELKTKDRADLLEAFLGALYVDKGLEYCCKFCEVCFFPRLQDFIMNQDWNDPKSKLQQCCLTLRTMDGGEPDIPLYKVIECKGPTNTREYTVAVYFRGRRLASGSGHSIQQAEMAAAGNALDASKQLFPQLNHQRRAIERSLKQRLPGSSKSSKC